MTKAPNENQEFYILNRYQYLMKIRSYLACNKNEEAANLIERVSVYFKKYKRTYMDMENELLKAILQYRMKIGDYKETLSQVLPKIENYHFIDMIAKEGIAIRELLQTMDTLPVSTSFKEEMLKAVDVMSVNYPNYLKVQDSKREELTDMEKKFCIFTAKALHQTAYVNCVNFPITH